MLTRASWARRAVQTYDVMRPLSCRLSYLPGMAQRDKRSVSLPVDLAKAIDEAIASGTSYNGWIEQGVKDLLPVRHSGSLLRSGYDW